MQQILVIMKSAGKKTDFFISRTSLRTGVIYPSCTAVETVKNTA